MGEVSQKLTSHIFSLPFNFDRLILIPATTNWKEGRKPLSRESVFFRLVRGWGFAFSRTKKKMKKIWREKLFFRRKIRERKKVSIRSYWWSQELAKSGLFSSQQKNRPWCKKNFFDHVLGFWCERYGREKTKLPKAKKVLNNFVSAQHC